jgi:hypothetical protein
MPSIQMLKCMHAWLKRFSRNCSRFETPVRYYRHENREYNRGMSLEYYFNDSMASAWQLPITSTCVSAMTIDDAEDTCHSVP